MAFGEEARDEIASRLAAIAIEAGRLLRGFERGLNEHRVKADGTPSSQADLAAEELIIRRLGERWPEVPVIAEETSNSRLPGEVFFLVDPLDGTRDFLHGSGEYSVNIALIAASRPVAAAVASPAMGRVWMAGAAAKAGAIPASGEDVQWQPIHARPAPQDALVALMSRRHGDRATEACLAALSIGTLRTASSAVKFCLIAAGEADIYVRCGPTMEWDTAAGDHILTCAGGCVVKGGGGVLTYGHHERGYLNGPFAALGDEALAPRLNLAAAA
jgi:3'(2'), 5'-bisphosphate nucleotidase